MKHKVRKLTRAHLANCQYIEIDPRLARLVEVCFHSSPFVNKKGKADRMAWISIGIKTPQSAYRRNRLPGHEQDR